MHRKQKQTFFHSRFVFFAGEVPKLSEGELAPVKAMKEEKGEELDTAGLVNQVNSDLASRGAQLKELPPALGNALRSEILKYLLASPGRFEKDEKKGLSAKEFAAYRAAMVSKVKELLKEYVPSEAEMAQIKKAKEAAKETQKASEQLKPIEAKEVADKPGEIADLPVLDQKFNQYARWNGALQQEAAAVMDQGAAVQKAYAAFKKARDGISSYKKFSSYLWPEDDAERIALQEKIATSKKKFDDTIKKYEAAKAKLDTYGSALGNVSNKLKQDRIKERDDKIAKVEKKSEETAEAKEKKEQQYKLLSAHQKNLEKQRDGLEKYAEKVSQSKDVAETREKTAKTKQEQLGTAEARMKASLDRIDEALKNPALPDDQRAQLEETKKLLEEKLGEIGSGVKAASVALESESKAAAALTDKEQDAANKSLSLKSHLEQQLVPALGSLNASIAALAEAKLQFATTREQVVSHYTKMFESYDAVDEAVDNAVLKNNLANEQMIGQLKVQRAGLDQCDVKPPSGFTGPFEATFGVVLGTIGGWATELGEGALDQSKWLYDTLERNKDSMGPVSYFFARAGTEILGTTIGVAGGLLEMAGGLGTMIAHPLDSLKGMGALVGRDPVTGDWSTGTAGHAWKEMGKALISYEDFAHGRFGVGAGKLFANIVTTVTGAGAVRAGGKAASAMAKSAFKTARKAGSTVPVAIAKAAGKATVAGGKATARFVATEVKTGVVGVGKGLRAAPGKLAEAAKAVPRALKKAPGVMVEAGARAKALGFRGMASEIFKAGRGGAEVIGKSFKSVGEGVAATIERAWGGKKFEHVRVRKLARKEAAILDELGKSSEKYSEYRAAYDELKNSGLPDHEIRAKLAAEKPHLYAEGTKFEKNLGKLKDAQKAFDDAVIAGMSSAENAEKVQAFLDARKVAQKGMLEHRGGFDAFRKLVEKNDPEALSAAEKLRAALVSGDAEAVAALKAKYPQWSKAFEFMEHQVAFGNTSREIALVRAADKVAADASQFALKGPEEIAKYIREYNKKNPPIPGEGRVLAQLPEGKGALILDENGKLRLIEKSAADTHFYSIFSEDIPHSLRAEGKTAKDVAGWIDQDGKIHYSSQYFQEKFGVGLRQREGKNVFVVRGKEMTPMEFFRTPEGKNVLKEMKTVKNHEVTHRLLENAQATSQGALGSELTKLVESDPELAKAFGARGEAFQFRSIQEFLCEVADGRVKLSPQAAAKVEAAVGRQVKGFSFDKVRQLDTKKLRFTSEDALRRSFAEAFTDRRGLLRDPYYRMAYDDYRLLRESRPDLANNPAEIRKLLGGERYAKAVELELILAREEKFAATRGELATLRAELDPVHLQRKFRGAQLEEAQRLQELYLAALKRNDTKSISLVRKEMAKGGRFERYAEELQKIEKLQQLTTRLEILDSMNHFHFTPATERFLLGKLDDLDAHKLRAIEIHGLDMEDVRGIVELKDPAVVRMLAADEAGHLVEYTDLLLNSPETAAKIFTPERIAILEANLGHPEFNPNYLERILMAPAEEVVVGGKTLHYYPGAAVGEGGIGTFFRAAIVDPDTKKLTFVGVKRAKPEVGSLGMEADGARHVLQIHAAEAAAGKPVKLNRPVMIADNGTMIFYEITEHRTPHGADTRDLSALIEDPDFPAAELYSLLADSGEGLAMLHRYGLIHADYKGSQVFRAQEGAKLGDFGSITRFEDFTTGMNYTGAVELPFEFDAAGKVTRTEMVYIGRTPAPTIGITPHYYSPMVLDAVAQHGPKYMWKIDAYAFGVQIDEMVTGRIHMPAAVYDHGKAAWVHDPSRVLVFDAGSARPLADPAANKALLEIARKLKDPTNLTYTIADAVRDIRRLTH